MSSAAQEPGASRITAYGFSFPALVGDDIRVFNPRDDGIWYDAAGVKEKFGVRPDRIIDYLSLIGDSVDNVPGVAKVGPKTAVKWLTQYGTLDNLVAHAGEISGAVGDNLRSAGLVAFGRMTRAVALVTVLIVVAVSDSSLGLPAAVVYALAFTVEFGSTLVAYFGGGEKR